MRILVYSGIMRRTKFNEEIAGRLVDLVHKGLNFKSACLEVGISEDSFARYRKADLDFDKQIRNAQKSFKKAKVSEEKPVDEGRKSEIVLEDSTDSHLDTEKPLKTPLNASESLSEEPEMYMGLPVYHELSDDIPPNKPFYYPRENAVQFFDYRRIRYSCPTDLWSKKHSVNLYGDEWMEEPGYSI